VLLKHKPHYVNTLHVPKLYYFYWMFSISGGIYAAGLYTPFVYSVAKAESLGADSKQASYILVVIGVGNTISRIATGFIADLPCVDSVLIYNVAAILAGLITCLVAVFDTYGLLIMYGALFGVSIGELHSTTVTLFRNPNVSAFSLQHNTHLNCCHLITVHQTFVSKCFYLLIAKRLCCRRVL